MQLFADVNIKNEDVGFVRVGQSTQIKLATYPFQQYGMLTGKVVHVSADATEANKSNANAGTPTASGSDSSATAGIAAHKARVQLNAQVLRDPQGNNLPLTPGMQIVVEINQGKRTVLEYLLSSQLKLINGIFRNMCLNCPFFDRFNRTACLYSVPAQTRKLNDF